MNYLEARTYLRSLINRTDFSDDLAKQFIQQSQDRLERWPQIDPLKYAPRPSFMDKLVSFTLDASANGAFLLPNDFLEMQTLYTEDNCGGHEMARVPLDQLTQIPGTAVGTPCRFTQIGGQIRMRPVPLATTTIYLRYYGTAAPLNVDTDENEWSVSCIDALVYGAAELAADHFEDERLPRFAQRFKEALGEIQDQTLNEQFSGPMAIAPAYDAQDYD
jgi:hypothetical protein